MGVWDFDRLCKPYIREWTLDHVLGNQKEEAKRRFLVHEGNGCYAFRHGECVRLPRPPLHLAVPMWWLAHPWPCDL